MRRPFHEIKIKKTVLYFSIEVGIPQIENENGSLRNVCDNFVKNIIKVK